MLTEEELLGIIATEAIECRPDCALKFPPRRRLSPMFDMGVWFQSAVSGLWYQDHRAAGSIRRVKVDGVYFDGPPIPDDDDESNDLP